MPFYSSTFHSTPPHSILLVHIPFYLSTFHSTCPHSILLVHIPFYLSTFHSTRPHSILPPLGTDRSNVVQIPGPNTNYPLPWEHAGNTLFKDVEVVWNSWGIDNPTPEDVAVAFASSGYYDCYRSDSECSRSVETGASLNQLLNNAPASFEGALLRFVKTGEYFYICSRNNNFTNRSQKGQITVISQ